MLNMSSGTYFFVYCPSLSWIGSLSTMDLAELCYLDNFAGSKKTVRYSRKGDMTAFWQKRIALLCHFSTHESHHENQ